MNTNLIIAMISTGVISAVGAKVLDVIGETAIAQYVRTAGVSLCGSMAVGVVWNLVSTLRKMG